MVNLIQFNGEIKYNNADLYVHSRLDAKIKYTFSNMNNTINKLFINFQIMTPIM